MICSNCKQEGAHYVPPSFNEPGFYICDRPTPGALSREQVERECQWLVEEHCGSAARKWLDTDAALRATIEQRQGQIDKLSAFILSSVPGEPSQSEGAVDTAIRVITQQAQEIERLKAERHTYQCAAEASLGKRLEAEQQLAAMTQARDEARGIVEKVNGAVIGSEGYFLVPSCVEAIGRMKASSNNLQQQLAAAQARCKELEEKHNALLNLPGALPVEQVAKTFLDYGRVYYRTEYDNFIQARLEELLRRARLDGLNQLQATLTARDERIQHLEGVLKFVGVSEDADSIIMDMKKYHASHRCELHRADPWQGIDVEQTCFVCLKVERDSAHQDAARLREALERIVIEAKKEPSIIGVVEVHSIAHRALKGGV